MSNDVLVIAEHGAGKLTDTTFELLGKAGELAACGGGQSIVALVGAADLATELGAADVVVTIDGDGLGDYTSEAYETVLADLVTARSPRLVLISTSTQGLDIAAALSAKCNAPLASYLVDVSIDGDDVVATAQIYGGKIMAEVALTGAPAIAAVAAGAFPADAGRGGAGASVEAAPTAGIADQRIVFKALKMPEPGDVDITAADVLVAVGRGVGSEDDIELVQEFADAIDAPVAASRPVTDAGWLPKNRQVGKSGQKVKPRAYLTFGISGAPEHLEGMRDADLIIACNTDEQAPIFEVAHYGTTADLFDLLPALTDLVD